MTQSKPQARDCYGDIAIYSPEATSCRIDLSDNTNLWGAPPSAVDAIKSLTPEDMSRYPRPYSAELREKLAEYVGVDAARIVTGCGSDDIIDCAMRAFAEPGDGACAPDPTFSMVPYFAKTNGLRYTPVAFDADFQVDAKKVLDTGARVIYLCTPNNPTGTTLSRECVERIVDGTRGIVIIDQAYVEFGGESFVGLVDRGHVLLTGTMSKAFGLAGLRVGYGIGSPEIVAAVGKARGPYKVSVPAEAAAIAALTNDRSWMSARVAEAIENRERFTRELQSLGYAPITSEANFVLVPVKSCAAESRRLSDAGVLVRAFSELAGIGDALRISVGPWEMMQQCLDVLGSAR